MGLATSEAHTSIPHRKDALHCDYKFFISPRLPLRQLIPLHIDTYCDSDWATDIDSRRSTSGTVTSVLQVPLAFSSRTQSTVATSSAEAELYAMAHRPRHQRQLAHLPATSRTSTSSSMTDGHRPLTSAPLTLSTTSPPRQLPPSL